MKDKFISAIREKRKIQITFDSEQDRGVVTRICAPMDFGPSNKFKDGVDRFHVWDYFPDDGAKPHPIPLEESQIHSMTVLDEKFDPAEFVKWRFVPHSWHISRDWGRLS